MRVFLNDIHIKQFNGPRRLLIHGFFDLVLLASFQKLMTWALKKKKKLMTCAAVSINSCIEVMMIFDNLMLKGKGQRNYKN